jgi:hypothetical protein
MKGREVTKGQTTGPKNEILTGQREKWIVDSEADAVFRGFNTLFGPEGHMELWNE